MKNIILLFDSLCSSSLRNASHKNSCAEKNTITANSINKRWVLIPLMVLMLFFGSGKSWGQSTGFNNTFLVLSLNGGANTYYDLNATTTSTDFNGANLGSFAAGTNNLVFKGAEHNIYKCGGADLTSTRVYYRIYLTSAGASGSFTSNNITYTSGFNNGCGGQDQKWDKLDYSTNLLSGLAPGNYSIQVYSDASTTLGDRFASNGGLNYTASFTVSGNYYSKSTGNLELTSSWGTNIDGTGNAPANFTTAGNTFNIRNNATPTIGASWTVSGTGSKIIVGDGTNACNFTVPSTFIVTSPTTDVSNNGTITRTSSGVQSFGTLNVLAGGTYDHNYATGSLPTATWNSTSTLLVSADLQTNNFSAVTFGNVTFRNSAGATMLSASANQTATIAGNLNLQGTGTIIMSSQGGFNSTLTVNGNVNISGNSTFRIESVNNNGTIIKRLLILGNYDQSNGTMDLATNTFTTMTNRQCILEVRGNFTHTGGTLTENASGASSVMITQVLLSKNSGTQTLESSGQTNSVSFNVAGSNAQCVVSATKTFTLSSGSAFQIANGSSNPDLSISGTFINISTVTNGFGNAYASSGNISLNNVGTYVHNTIRSVADYLAIANNNSGSTVIFRGSSTLQPSIALSGRTYHHLTIESTSGALSLSGTGTSSFIVNGDLTIGANCTFGPNITGTPGHSIKGNISIGSSGTLNYNPAAAGTININGTGTQTIIGAGTFTTGSNATLAVGASSTIDFGSSAAIAGTGTFTTASGSTLITANTSGINGSLTLTNKSLNAGTNYTFNNSAPSAQVTGAALTAANNITLNNSAGLTLSANTSITGTLTLTSGKLTTNGFTLTLSNAVSGSSSSNYIVADATGTATFNGVSTARIFPLGTASAYAPMTVTAGSSTNYTAYVTATLPCSATDATKMVNLAWGLSGSNSPSQVVFQWPSSSQAGSFAPATSCDFGRYNSSCPYNVTNISAASGSGPYTLTCTTGLSSTSNIYVIGNQHAVYIAAPTVTTTVAASSITNTTASSGGETITGSSITSKGVVWHTSTAPTVALSTKTNDGTGSADFTSSVTSLSPETFYYVRAYVTNPAGTGYGDEKTFRTLSNPATAQASSLIATATSSSNIDLTWNAATFPSSGATNKGYVLLRATSSNTPSLGNSNGAAPSAGANTTIVSSVIAENATSISSSVLAASTQYNYLLIPYTWDGTNATTYNYLTASAPSANATTQSGSTPPVLTTNAVSSVLSSTATLNGEITSDGGASVTARGFVYSTSDNTPTIGEGGVTDQSSGSGTGIFSENVSSLTPNTTYYYQAYASNTSGTSYGGVISFTTLKAEPSAQATTLVFSSNTTSSFSTAFTAATGSPDGYLVIRSTSASLSADPLDGTTYTAGNSVGGGTVVSVGSTISGISNSSLSAGTTYYTFVFAYNNSGSNIDYLTALPLTSSAITITGVPATPTFSSITTTGFTVDWTATTGASTYRLDVSTASNFASYVSGYQDLTVNTNSQAVTGLAANTLYYVRVRAVNASGTSANSTSANSATLSNAPTVGTASSITTSGLTANWTAPSSQGAVSFTYTVELSTSAIDFSSPVSTVSSIASSTITNAFSSLAEGTTYYYRIKAVNSAGSSAWSSVSVGASTLTSSISLTALGTNFTQDFNTLVNSGTSSSLPSGWYLSESGSSANSTFSANDGSASSGETYSYGTSTNSDRAFGGLRSGSVIPTIGAKFQNNTGSVINNLSISYIGEQWRLGATGRNDRLDFQYSLDATSISSAGTWTDVNSLDFSGPISSGTTGALNGNSSTNRTEITHLLTGLTIADGAIFYIRWSDVDATGADDGLAVDDFSIKPCGTVSAPTASDQAFCSAASPTVASLSATGTSIQWYSASSGGTALSTSTALTTATTYYATQTDGGCESVSRTAVVVTINTNPSVPTGTATQIFCSSSSPTVNELSATGTSIQWYEASSGGSALATNTSLVDSTIYYATQTVSGCESTTRFAVTASLVINGTWLGSTSTDWNTASNWCGGVPTSSTNVVINSGASNFPDLSTGADGFANSVTITSGGSLTIGGSETLTITAGGSFTNNGTFTASSSTSVAFAGTGSVTGTVAFNNVTVSGTLTPSSATTINGILTVNNGGSIATNSPIFGASSTLQYNYGGGFGARRNQALEWPASNGPTNLTITNGSWIQLTSNRSLSGNANITNGSLQASGVRNLTMNGTTQTLNISTTSGGAIYGTDNVFGNDLSLVIANGSTTTLTGDDTSNSDDEKKFLNVTVNAGGTLALSRGILCKYGTFSVNGTLQINANGYIQTTAGVAPTYGSSAILKYNSGNSYGRGLEWSATSGAGYPNTVQISNNTTLNLNNGANVARQIAGTLTVDSGSTLSLEGMTIASPTDIGLTVVGNVINNGTVTLASSTERLKCVDFTNNSGATTTLSSSTGGDLELTGSLIDNATFNSNTRAVFFTGNGVQEVSGTGTFNIDYIVSNKASGAIRMLTNLLVEGPNGGNAMTLTNSSDILDLNGFALTLGKATVASTFSGNGSIRGSLSSSISVLGTGALGTMRFDQTTLGTTNALNSLSINRTSTGSVVLGNTIAVSNALTITSGNLNLGTAIHTAGSLSLGGASQTTSSSYGGTSSPAGTINATYFAATTGVVNVGSCSEYSITSTAVSSPTCSSGAIVTLATTTAANLPNGTYTVFYTLTGTNTGSFSTIMTVSGGTGSGTFTTGTLANTGLTTITIDYLRNGCVSRTTSGNIEPFTVNANNTAAAPSLTPTLCINSALTNITIATTGATGIVDDGVDGSNGLPAGVSATWASNTITISGTPTASGAFNYSISLIGACGSVNATGAITVTAAKTSGIASSTPTLCINTALTNITHSTLGAIGIGTSTGLPSGVTAAWSENTITISGTPTTSGIFNYSIPLTGDCGSANATGTITVTALTTYYADTDGDGFGNPSVTVSNCQAVFGYVTNNSDTNDSLLTYVDGDGDGFGSTVFAPSGVTNNFDSNDSLLTYLDLDDDGYGSTTLVSNGVTNNTDCNDSLSTTYPGAAEICYDGIDNDCDGSIDEGCVPLVSVVQTAQCGQTLATIDDYVYANLVAGAQGYRFKVTNITTGQVQTIERFLRVFKITQLPSYAFNTEYQVEVAVRKFNVWQPSYGAPCTVKTPATTTQLTSPVNNLSALTDVIYANLVPFATGYRFKITNASNAADTQIINRSLREFRMSLLAGITYNNATYNVQVAVRNTDGVTYLPYGPVCTVITPAFPSTFLQSSQCDDYAVPNNATILYAEPFADAQGYRFRLQNGGQGYSQEVDRYLRTVRLSDFTGLTPGSTYTVKVALKINGVWGSFTGKSCSIIVPGATRAMETESTVVKGDFAAVAYPNPFANTFAIQVKTSSQEVVQLKVYDMIGRLVEQRETSADSKDNMAFGERYPSGVYSVVVTQGIVTETLRVIKR